MTRKTLTRRNASSFGNATRKAALGIHGEPRTVTPWTAVEGDGTYHVRTIRDGWTLDVWIEHRVPGEASGSVWVWTATRDGVVLRDELPPGCGLGSTKEAQAKTAAARAAKSYKGEDGR